MATTVLDVLRKEIQDDISNASEVLANGTATDHAEYKFIVGQIRGLSLAMRYVDDLAKNMDEYDD